MRFRWVYSYYNQRNLLGVIGVAGNYWKADRKENFKKKFASKEAEFIAVYGRRRVLPNVYTEHLVTNTPVIKDLYTI